MKTGEQKAVRALAQIGGDCASAYRAESPPSIAGLAKLAAASVAVLFAFAILFVAFFVGLVYLFGEGDHQKLLIVFLTLALAGLCSRWAFRSTRSIAGKISGNRNARWAALVAGFVPLFLALGVGTPVLSSSGGGWLGTAEILGVLCAPLAVGISVGAYQGAMATFACRPCGLDMEMTILRSFTASDYRDMDAFVEQTLTSPTSCSPSGPIQDREVARVLRYLCPSCSRGYIEVYGSVKDGKSTRWNRLLSTAF